MGIVHEGLIFIFIPLATGIIFLYLGGTLFTAIGTVFLVLGLFCSFFFRDPARTIAINPAHILAPGDGTIMEVTEEGGNKVIRIFLSVFNVHLQRSPVAGKITSIVYKPGKCVPAMNAEAHIVNEQNIFTIESPQGTFTVTQISGIIARRVVAWSKQGDSVQQGDKIGMIRFGSQVDITMPTSVTIKVKKGDKVTSGITVLATIGKP